MLIAFLFRQRVWIGYYNKYERETIHVKNCLYWTHNVLHMMFKAVRNFTKRLYFVSAGRLGALIRSRASQSEHFFFKNADNFFASFRDGHFARAFDCQVQFPFIFAHFLARSAICSSYENTGLRKLANLSQCLLKFQSNKME